MTKPVALPPESQTRKELCDLSRLWFHPFAKPDETADGLD
jgi:hypothetical protein